MKRCVPVERTRTSAYLDTRSVVAVLAEVALPIFHQRLQAAQFTVDLAAARDQKKDEANDYQPGGRVAVDHVSEVTDVHCEYSSLYRVQFAPQGVDFAAARFLMQADQHQRR